MEGFMKNHYVNIEGIVLKRGGGGGGLDCLQI